LHTPQRVHISESIQCTSRLAPLIALLVQLRRQTRQPVHFSGMME
jgi:hypothetical protein